MESPKTPIKNFKELKPEQQALFLALSSTIEKHAKENNMNTKEGIYSMLEMLVTLTLAMKSFYLIKSTELPVTQNKVTTKESSEDN